MSDTNYSTCAVCHQPKADVALIQWTSDTRIYLCMECGHGLTERMRQVTASITDLPTREWSITSERGKPITVIGSPPLLTNDPSESGVTMGNTAIARHDQVRRFVEARYPEHFVTRIAEEVQSTYERGEQEGSDEVLFKDLQMGFTVDLRSRARGGYAIRCHLSMINSPEQLYVTDETFTR